MPRSRPRFPRLASPVVLSLLLLSVLLPLSSSARAQRTPMLVQDLHPGFDATAGVGLSGPLIALGSQTLVPGTTLRELDLITGEVTEVVAVEARNLVPSPVVGQALFRGGVGETLWRTDGTELGTVELSTVQVSGDFSVTPSAVYFAGVTPAHGKELWRSNGTAGGTVRLTDLVNGAGSANVDLLGVLPGVGGDSIAIFSALSDSHGGRELWSHSTNLGTQFVAELEPGTSGANIRCFRATERADCPVFPGGPILISADTVAEGEELWAVTATGATLLADIAPGTDSSYPNYVLELTSGASTEFVFWAKNATSGRELWITDGTPGGTSMVVDLVPGPDDTDPSDAVSMGERVLFSAVDSAGWEPWITDGTPSGTMRLADLAPGPDDSSPYAAWSRDGLGIFSTETTSPFGGGNTLWVTDGTTVGTTAIGAVYSEVTTPLEVSGSFYFEGWTAADGGEIWQTDFTAVGTEQVTDTASRNESELSSRTQDGELPYFFAATQDQGGYPNLTEVWASDGTLEGTEKLLDDPSTSFQVFTRALGLSFGMMWTSAKGHELMVSDGTAAGTEVLDLVPGPNGSFPGAMIEFDGRLFLNATTNGLGAELHVSDGTVAGTSLFKDLNPGTGSSTPHGFQVFQGELYFFAYDKLWKSDGTVAGTVVVADGNPGGPWAPSYLTPMQTPAADDVMIFIAKHPTLGDELWITDGTGPGTQVLQDVNPAGDSVDRTRPPTAHNGLLFTGLDDGTHGREPWVTDGTALGTQLVKDLVPGPTGSGTFYGVSLPAGLLFRGYDPANGAEVWISDGTPAGTGILVDIAPGPNSAVNGLIPNPFDGRVWFTADPEMDNQAGRVYELWSTDGTELGTRFEWQYAPRSEPDPIMPSEATAGLLFLRTTTEAHGQSLYAFCAACDYGDADDAPYPTVIDSVGARHAISPLHLGALIDAEADGQPFGGALGDDQSDTDDEDGVVLPVWINPGYTSPIEVTLSMPGVLDAWVDSDRDGEWEEGAERLLDSVALTAGNHTLAWSVPVDFPFGAESVLRFRVSSDGGLTPYAHANDGEVEDYEATFLNSGPIFFDGFESGDATAWIVEP